MLKYHCLDNSLISRLGGRGGNCCQVMSLFLFIFLTSKFFLILKLKPKLWRYVSTTKHLVSPRGPWRCRAPWGFFNQCFLLQLKKKKKRKIWTRNTGTRCESRTFIEHWLEEELTLTERATVNNNNNNNNRRHQQFMEECGTVIFNINVKTRPSFGESTEKLPKIIITRRIPRNWNNTEQELR